VNRLLHRKAIIVLASDFQDSSFDKQLKMTNKKHDLVNIVISDELEDDLPKLGIVPFRDAETGEEILVDTSSEKVRHAYKVRRLKQKKELNEYFLRNKVDAIRVFTNQSYIRPLADFFRRRINRY
jgi:hypothetical protein